ncbi:MAG: VUT family protein [Thermoactinomyces sp.]
MRVILYILSILAANVLTAALPPLQLGILYVPVGTFLIGFTFIMRDIVQNHIGRRRTYNIILISLVLSAISSYLLGDTLWVVFASALSFAISETTDTEIYSRLPLPIGYRILYSGLVGGLLDSTIFVIVGISPLGTGFVPWEAVPLAIAGQVIVKSIMQLVGALIINKFFIPIKQTSGIRKI